MNAPPELRPLSPRAREIMAAARAMIERDGVEALSMRRLATVLGMRAPSIYKHFPTKRAVEAAVIDATLAEFGERLYLAVSEAADDGGDPGEALLAAYRSAALGNHALYRLATTGELPREQLTPGLEEWAGEPFFLVTGDPWQAQALWSFAHGMVILELDGRFPPGSELDRTWAAGVAAFGRVTRRDRAPAAS